MAAEELQQILSAKEKKAKEYRPCDAYWLLVAVDFIDPAQDQEIRVDGISLVCHLFERVFIHKPVFRHLVQIAPKRIAQ